MKDINLEFSTGALRGQTPVKARPGLYRMRGKRWFDIGFAVVLLPLLAPVLVVLWALVRTDGGAGLYSQMRIGKDGRAFRCWKFRTMVTDADAKLQGMCRHDPALAREWQEYQKLAEDPRITRFGGFLRSTSLDELPQIWNIIRGDMSFVGPRPFMEVQQDLYKEAGGRAYYTLRPGITGFWQVFGRSSTSFADRVKYDALYAQKLSFWVDMALIWKTFGVVLRRTGH